MADTPNVLRVRVDMDTDEVRAALIRAKADAWDECSQWHEDYYVHHQTAPVFDTSAYHNPYRPQEEGE